MPHAKENNMRQHFINQSSSNQEDAEIINRLVNCKAKHYSSFIENFDTSTAIKEKFHIVGVAYLGLTHTSNLCQVEFNISQPEQELIFSEINTKKETGTLFPKFNLTFLPYRYKTSSFMTIEPLDYTNGKGYSDVEIEVQINDAFKAEIEFIKSNKMLFDLRDLGKEQRRYRNIAQSILKDTYSNMDWDIYFYI